AWRGRRSEPDGMGTKAGKFGPIDDQSGRAIRRCDQRGDDDRRLPAILAEGDPSLRQPDGCGAADTVAIGVGGQRLITGGSQVAVSPQPLADFVARSL